jgi:hypothetical protein
VPDEYKKELEGVLAGCRAANRATKVNWLDLWTLNVGFDGLLSYGYTGGMPIGVEEKLPRALRRRHLRIPFTCNGFSAHGPLVEGGGHFLGRDFQFSTVGVLQDTACLIVQNPAGAKRHSFVSMTAPGMIGCIAGMNEYGLGVGVDMAPAGNCDPSRPGFNSLLLARHSIENGRNCQEAVDLMVEAQRGVSWDYILAGYEGDDAHRACIVEAGTTVELGRTYADHVHEHLREVLEHPDHTRRTRRAVRHLIESPLTGLLGEYEPRFRKGLMARWSGYEYPDEIGGVKIEGINRVLFNLFGKQYNPADFGERGYIDATWTDRNCPYGYYFAPQRERDPHLILVTNQFIIPEMRLYAMHPWTNLVCAGEYDDIQWRYDELDYQLLTELFPAGTGTAPQPLSLDRAKEIIDFLSPNPAYGKFPDYYNPKRRCHDREPWETVPVHGSVSLMDLQKRVMHSHYGYHGDEWVQVHLMRYVGEKTLHDEKGEH